MDGSLCDDSTPRNNDQILLSYDNQATMRAKSAHYHTQAYHAKFTDRTVSNTINPNYAYNPQGQISIQKPRKIW